MPMTRNSEHPLPRHMFMWSIMDELACHKRRYGGRQFEDRVRQAGYEII